MLTILRPLLFAVCLGIIISHAEAEPQGYTPEQVQTLQAFKKPRRSSHTGKESASSFQTRHEGEFVTCELPSLDTPSDSILVGKNVVFSKNWLKLIGNGQLFTEQQFQIWKMRTDFVYDCCLDLFGDLPKNGPTIVIDIIPAAYFGDRNKDGRPSTGHAHAMICLVCLNAESFQKKIKGMKTSFYDTTTIHEIGHRFASQRVWEAEPETFAHLTEYYVMEKMRGVTFPLRGRGGSPRYRRSQFERRNKSFALKNFSSEEIETFAYGTDAYDYYVWGLVDKVGWETYKKVFRSYDLNLFMYSAGARDMTTRTTNARDFLTRLEDFSGKPDVLRTLPDKGKIFDEHFAAAATPVDNADNKAAAPSVAAASLSKPVQKPIKKPAVSIPISAVLKTKPSAVFPKMVQKPEPAAPTKEEILTLQTELKTLQEQLDTLPKIRKSEPQMVRLYNEIATLQNKLNLLQ